MIVFLSILSCCINMLKALRSGLSKNPIGMCNRSLWKWIEDSFNVCDDERIKEIGPNMACAEWLMKNGAQVRWKGCKEFVSHYDCLPHSQCGFLGQFKIEQVHAGKEASISHVGFRHFRDCTEISDIAFVQCNTITNEALNELLILKSYLKRLEIDGCVNITREGLLNLQHLHALKLLELKNLRIANDSELIDSLENKMPNCEIHYARESGE